MTEIPDSPCVNLIFLAVRLNYMQTKTSVLVPFIETHLRGLHSFVFTRRLLAHHLHLECLNISLLSLLFTGTESPLFPYLPKCQCKTCHSCCFQFKESQLNQLQK